SFTCGTSTIVDMDGNSYNTVSIGTQCWLKENLKVGKYNDGSVIPLDATGGTAGNVTGEGWSGLSSGAKTVYEHNPTYLNAMGYLYNGYAATDPKGICPSGWKIPTISEWQTLETFLRVGSEVGHKMMVTSAPYGWTQSLKNNSSGFSALSSGYRIGFQSAGNPFNGGFTRAGVPGSTSTPFYAKWWSSTSVSSTSINMANLEDGQLNNSLWLGTEHPTRGLSIRCIKI
ncbi:MAG: fibrobacter succinogenes major paralogous domain-containing protein, partial [Saprospiraceae bacterium]